MYGIHGKAVSPRDFGAKPCLWGKCGRGGKSRNWEEEEEDVEMGGVAQQELYGDEEAFKEHLEKAHIVPLSWHMGDGPKGSTIGMLILSFFLHSVFVTPYPLPVHVTTC